MAKTVLPIGVEAPKFTGRAKPESKPKAAPITEEEIKPVEKPAEAAPVVEKPQETNQKPVTKPIETVVTKPVEAKPQETKPTEENPEEAKPQEDKPAETKPQDGKPTNGGLKPDKDGNIPGYIKEDDLQDYEYLLKPKQKMLKGWRVFFPYFFCFLYNLLLLVALAALFVLPIVKLETPLAADAPKLPIDVVGLVGMSDKFEGLNSIAEIGYAIVMGALNNAGINGILVAVGQMFGFVTLAIFLVIMIIWFVIKLILSFLSLLGVIVFKHKRKKVIDNFFFKNTHQYYSLGLLDRDWTFFIFFIYVVFLWGFMNVKAILGQFGITNDIINGIVIFKAFENTDLFNFGNICLIVVVGALLVFRILYKLIVHGLSRKVKKTYVLKKKKRKNKKNA